MPESHASDTTGRLAGFADFASAIIRDWKVPGLAVAVVQDGQVVFSRGFGLRDVARGLEVTPRTLFPIASCTKAFTTTTMGILADEGKLDWDTPVRTYLPALKLYDLFATERITPRDLVTHRSGLPRHDLVWYGSPYSRAELVERLQHLEPSKDLRAVYQYNNLMYMVAGHLVGHLAGESWESFTRRRILDPLGMASTNFSVTESQRTADYSFPYKEEKDEVKVIPFYETQGAIAPAGAIVSGVAEMSQWVLLQLNKGKHDETRIVSEAQLAEIHSPQMVTPGPGKYPELPALASYGLGWSIQPYRGHTMISHSGGIDGFASLVTFFPQDGFGVVVLSNLAGNPAPAIVTYGVCDRLLGLDEVPWNERFRQEREEFKQAGERKKEKSESDRVQGTQPSHPLDSYVGDYEHPGYGVLTVEREGDGLKATLNGVTCLLKHYHYDVFEMLWEKWDASYKVTFSTSVRGNVDGFAAPLESTVKDVVFRRVPEKEMTEKSFLEKLVGVYEWSGMALTVALKGERALVASVPGWPPFELEPYRGTEFVAKGLTGFSVEFRLDASGAAAEAVFTHPFGVLPAKRKGAG